MRFTAAMLAGAVLAVAACDDAPTEPTATQVAGSYRATTLNVTEDGTTTDALEEGASLSVDLESGGTTTGTFTVPGSISESGQEEVYDLAGSWSLSGRVVTFDHPADTFLRDMGLTYEVSTGRLQGQDTFGSATVRLVLAPQ